MQSRVGHLIWGRPYDRGWGNQFGVCRSIMGRSCNQGSVVRSGVGLSIRSRSFDQAHHQGTVIWSSVCRWIMGDDDGSVFQSGVRVGRLTRSLPVSSDSGFVVRSGGRSFNQGSQDDFQITIYAEYKFCVRYERGKHRCTWLRSMRSSSGIRSRYLPQYSRESGKISLVSLNR